MSFAIEVPGEANPLSLPELGKALHAATSLDNAQRQSAGKQLQAWESHQDYYPALQTAFLAKDLPREIRFLAIILLKNGIDRYWRPNARNSIKPAERHLIRSRLLHGSMDEEDRSFALHNALVVAKIVRIDYPDQWPEAMSTIVEAIRSTRNVNQVHLGGALLVLLRVVKELATARLRRSQVALQKVTPELVQLLGEIYTERTAYWLEFLIKGRGDEDDADLSMQSSLTVLKILRRLVTVGYEHPHNDEMVQGFWSLSQSQFGQFLDFVGNESRIPAPYQDIVGKHLIQFTKLHIEMCESHPASFPVLPNSIKLVADYWGLVKRFSEDFEKSTGIKQTTGDGPEAKAKFEGPLHERIALKGLLLLRVCVRIAFQPVSTIMYRSQETKNLEKAAVQTIKTDLFTKDFLSDIVQVIISKLFVFRQSDFEAWEEDPEEWENLERTEGNAWEWAVRPCAERLLIDLLTHYKELTKPLVDFSTLAVKIGVDVVMKEAAYTALGCAAANMHEDFDFDRLLTSVLVKDMEIQDPMAKLLRRRVAILVSQWIPIKVSEASRPTVYEIFRHLLNKNDERNDEVVRITAARQLKWIAEDFGFQPEAFLPFAADTFNLLIGLLQEVSVDETKLAILETVRIIVTRLETHVSQFGDAIMATLPNLWESAGSEEYMMKQSILAITSALVMAMRVESQRYQSFMVPLLMEAMNPESALHLHLIEESVELWKSIQLQSVPPLSAELVQLVELALPLLEYETEVANSCLEIVKNYIILAPEAMLSDGRRQAIMVALMRTLDSRSRGQVQLGTKSIELLLQVAQELGGQDGVSVLVQDMLQLGLLAKIMEGLHSAWEASQSTGPNRKTRRINSLTETDYFALLARIALAGPNVFATMLASFSPGGNDFGPAWAWLSTEWFASFDAMAELERQKLSCLALTRLCELPNPMQDLVLGKLQDLLSMWTMIVSELTVGAEDSGRDNLVWTELASSEYDTPLDVREREFAAKDPVHTVVTFDFVMEHVRDLVQRSGGEAVFEANWAVNVDKEVLAGFQKLSQAGGAGHG
ncbi:importin-beta domain-containing protein [Thozetella sp. PMI_491]|nr:importin-beta domain-containing protein [Thozetella sp. PMI_491]